MRISPVNNNKQNTNFGMLKVTDANTLELAQEARRILIDMIPVHLFRVSDALNSKYEPRFSNKEGGYYMGDRLFQSKLPIYEQDGDIFIFDGELNKAKDDNRFLDERFDAAFSNPVRMTIATLRDIATRLKAQKTAVLDAEVLLAQTKAKAANAQRDAFRELGAAFLNNPHGK